MGSEGRFMYLRNPCEISARLACYAYLWLPLLAATWSTERVRPDPQAPREDFHGAKSKLAISNAARETGNAAKCMDFDQEKRTIELGGELFHPLPKTMAAATRPRATASSTMDTTFTHPCPSRPFKGQSKGGAGS